MVMQPVPVAVPHAVEPYQVLQRDADGYARVGGVEGVVDLPTGGPYDVVNPDGSVAHDVMVGDIWVLAGQSNMEGMGGPDFDDPHPSVRLFDMARVWAPAREPLHRLWESPDACHRVDGLARLASGAAGTAGLGLAFAKTWVESEGVPVGLLPAAHGGTSMAQWAPSPVHRAHESLYASMLAGVQAAGGRVAGVLWYQGEADAVSLASAEFEERLAALVATVRSDLGRPDLPFFHVQLGRFVGDAMTGVEHHWSAIREVQRRAAPLAVDGVVTAIDLDLHDAVHLRAAELRRLGRRLARVAAGCRAPNLLDVVMLDDAGTRLRVRFDGVSGSLRPRARVGGFSVRSSAGVDRHLVQDAAVDDRDECSVVVSLRAPVGPEDGLCYGWGLNPPCLLVDSADMAVPAFGPVGVAARAAEGRVS